VQAGVKHRGVHHMRHAYVTMLAEQGVHERVAQQLAGHADSRITREVYTHVTARMLDGAADAIERVAQSLHGLDVEEKGPELGPRPVEGPSKGGELEQAKALDLRC
jgi:intergrase/recombinase